MTKDEITTQPEKPEPSGAPILIHHLLRLWGAHAPSRADFGALAEIPIAPTSTSTTGKVRDHEGVIASTRGACAPQHR